MSPSKQSHSTSNRHGENVQMNVLASAYAVDSSARLAGFHYSTTGAGGTFSTSQLLRVKHKLTDISRGKVVSLRSVLQGFHHLRQVPLLRP